MRRPSRLMLAAFCALAGVLWLLTVRLVVDPPENNPDPATGALILGVLAALVTGVAWRLGSRGQWFYRHGFRQKGFFSSAAFLYAHLSEVSLEDLSVSYRGRHHTVIIRYEADGRAGKVLLVGRAPASHGFDELRDPEADDIFELFAGEASPGRKDQDPPD